MRQVNLKVGEQSMRRIGEVATAAIAVKAVAVGWSASPVSGPAAWIQTLTFHRTDTFTVPTGVQCATFEVTSAQGGDGLTIPIAVQQRLAQ